MMNSIRTFAKPIKFHNISKIAPKNILSKDYTVSSTIPSIETQALSLDTQKEIEHHSKIAPQWWSKSGPMIALHALNELRVPLIRDGLLSNKFIKDLRNDGSVLLEGYNILEVGCGGGILTEALVRLKANVTGIDLGKDLIKVAKEHSESTLSSNLLTRLEYKNESVADHAKENKDKYDAVVLSEVIEHVDNKIEFLTHSIECLKKGGSLFITTPNQTLASLLFVIGVAEYIFKIVPQGTHSYDKFINPLDLQRILDTFNCSTVLINGMIYIPFMNTWQWVPTTDFCYALQAIKLE